MVCLAITRQGFGDVYVFENDREAYFHPIVQYGDAIIRHHEDLPELYNRLEWIKLMRIAGYENQLLEESMVLLSGIEQQGARVRSARTIWDFLVRKAKSPPNDIETVCAVIQQDRAATDLPQKENKMDAETDTQPRLRDTGEFDANSLIHYGKDKEGNAWSADNCPYLANSKRSVRWSKLREGMTVQQALENGQSLKNLRDMTERGFIVIAPASADKKHAA